MQPAEPSADAVRLSVPAALEYVRIVRLTGSGVASRLGFDVEEIENFRVALDELASMAIEVAATGELEVTFFTTETELPISTVAGKAYRPSIAIWLVPIVLW